LAAVETGQPVIAIEGDSAFGFSGMESEVDAPTRPAGASGAAVCSRRYRRWAAPVPSRISGLRYTAVRDLPERRQDLARAVVQSGVKDHRFLWLPALAMSRASAEGFAQAGSS
jgi:hypothetical protein